MKGSKKEKLV